MTAGTLTRGPASAGTRGRLAPAEVALVEAARDPVGPAAPLDAGRELGVPVRDAGCDPEPAGRGLDLGSVTADRRDHGRADLFRRRRAEPRRRLRSRLGEHPGLAD